MITIPAHKAIEKNPNKAGTALRSFGGSVYKLCGCCVGLPMRPQHAEAQQSRNHEIKETAEFGGVFTQLGPNDVSYKVRTEPKMVHQYTVGDLLGEGMPSTAVI